MASKLKEEKKQRLFEALGLGVILMSDIHFLDAHLAKILAGGGIAFCLYRWWRHDREEKAEAARPAPPTAPPEKPEDVPEPPEERVYVSRSPYDLWKERGAGNTDAVAALNTGKYAERWLRLPQARLLRLEPEHDGRVVALVEVGGPMVVLVSCTFDAPRWQTALQRIDPGQSVALAGKIAAFRGPLLAMDPHIMLKHCELLTAKAESRIGGKR